MSPRRFAPRVLALLPVGLFLFTLVLGWPLTAQQADNPTLPPPVVPDGFRGVQPAFSPVPSETPSMPSDDLFGNHYAPLSLIAPVDGQRLARAVISFVWAAHPDAIWYELTIRQGAEQIFRQRFIPQAACAERLCILQTAMMPHIPPLHYGQEYEWRVKARLGTGKLTSITHKFAVEVPLRNDTASGVTAEPVERRSANSDGRIVKLSSYTLPAIDWINPDGSGPVPGAVIVADFCGQLSMGFCTLAFPALSTDQERVAFVGAEALGNNESGTRDIYVVDREGGGNVERLTNDFQAEYWLAWSPTRNEIAYSRKNNSGGKYDLWIRNLDTQASTMLASGGMYPTWSPNGNRISFVNGYQITTGNDCGIWSIRRDGTDAQLVALPDNGNCQTYAEIDRRPTANEYVFHSANAFAPGLRLLTVNTNGTTTTTTLTEGYDRNANWSPDGTRVVYEHSSSAVPDPTPDSFELRIFELTVGPIVLATSDPNLAEFHADWNGEIPPCIQNCEGEETPTPTLTPTIPQLLYDMRSLVASGDFSPALFDSVFIATSPGNSQFTPIMSGHAGMPDLREALDSLSCVDPTSTSCIGESGELTSWTRDAFSRCSTIPGENDSGGNYEIAEYNGLRNKVLWRYCLAHVGVMSFIKYVDMFHASTDHDVTYNELIGTIIYSELSGYSYVVCNSWRYSATGSTPSTAMCLDSANYPFEPTSWIWTDETFARRLFSACSADGCQLSMFELYEFLSYFQPVTDGKLDNNYALYGRLDYIPQARAIVERSVLNVVRYPLNSWFGGLANKRPTGFANDTQVDAQEAVWLVGRKRTYSAGEYTTNSNGCNSDAVAFSYSYRDPATGIVHSNVFFGTYFDFSVNEASEVCKLFQFSATSPALPVYQARP